jgi:putative phosphoesterase
MTRDNLDPAEAIAGTSQVRATRIGLLSDDHNAEQDGSDLPEETLRAFEGVDLIVHLGHMGVKEQLARGVLDRLGRVAPVLAVRDYSTNRDGERYVTPADGERVKGLTRVIEAGGLRIGALHNLSLPPGPEIVAPPAGLPELGGVEVKAVLAEKFGGPVDVVAYASTHRPAAILAGGVLFVNPGSPTYPKGPGRVAGQRSLGTVGILDVRDGVAAFEVIDLAVLERAASESEAQPVGAAS